ncbi:MAG TPA: TRCF domain-containing protein, partial [Dehalococcoidia bacterium]|nr:TRCF domain-containing protein [Dehalococcoidia bacterium]
SGYMAAVGFDLYCRLLAEAAERMRAMMKGETPPPPREGPEVSIELPLSAHLPQSYVPDLNQRLALYQRMSDARERQEVESIRQELVDRFGEPPQPVRSLLYVILVRALASQAGVQALATEDGQVVLKLSEGLLVPREELEARAPRGVHLGRTLVRVELGEGWRTRLLEVLESLAAQPVAMRNRP